MGSVIDTTSIILDGKEYLLLRDEDGKRIAARRWSVQSKPLTTLATSRADVQEGTVENERLLVIDDWSEGLCGDREGMVGGVHLSENVHGHVAGALFPVQTTTSEIDTNDEGANVVPTAAVAYNNETFIAHGRYVYRYANGAKTVDKDFTAGKIVTDLVVHNDALLAALGQGTKIQSRATDGTWTEASDNTYAVYFARVEDRLWRCENTNEVSNVGPTDNPLTLLNWSSGISVGDDDYAITDLNGYGERLAVSKVDGLYLGDSAAVFPNVLPMIAASPDPENGRNTLVKGQDVYYPHANGCIRYRIGGAEELGIQKVFPSATLSDLVPGTRITAMAIEGMNIWAACEPAFYPRARPTGFQKTVNDGVAYTDYTSEVTDNNMTTVANLNSLDTVANGDWVIVGYSAEFYGVILDLIAPNTNASALTLQYWNGSAWTNFSVGGSVMDRTTKSLLSTPQVTGTKALARSGAITWSVSATAGWAASTINSINAFWVRLGYSAALDAAVSIAEAWVLTSAPRIHLYRGRPGRHGDRRADSVVWEPYSYLTGMSYPGAMLFTADHYPHSRREQLVVSGRQIDIFTRIPVSAIEMPGGQNSGGGRLTTPKYDGGTPFVTKQFLNVSIRGKNIDSDRDIALEYRLNDDTAWTVVNLVITANPYSVDLSAVSGRTIQFRIAFNAWSGASVLEYPQINQITVRYRERPTTIDEFTAMLHVQDASYGPHGGELPAAHTQLANLEALVYGAPVTLISPVRQSKTVMVQSVRQVELLQEGLEYPAVAVELVATEVA